MLKSLSGQGATLGDTLASLEGPAIVTIYATHELRKITKLTYQTQHIGPHSVGLNNIETAFMICGIKCLPEFY